MAVLSILVFGAAITAALYAIWATVRPELARIVDLLAYGPVAIPAVAPPVPARSSLRNVSVRAMPSPQAQPRAVA